MFANAHRAEREIPFTPEDFLGTGNREQRKREAGQNAVELFRANQNLSKITQAAKPEELVDVVPQWALDLGKKHKEKYGR